MANKPEFKKASDFMKSMRPYLFSDSRSLNKINLSKSMLELELENITVHRKENEFEALARRLAEREICPNLIPQTGPVGGGDSLTDAETYPVSPALTICWYVGTPTPSPVDENWAFAFSAKKDWKSKIKSDIAKVMTRDRKYNRFYFVTSQPVKDKIRAETEEALTKLHNVDVRILDRTWIVEKTFSNKHEALVVESLGLSETLIPQKSPGSRDTERAAELETIEQKLLDNNQYVTSHQKILDLMRAGKLCRWLELPRHRTDGFFNEAERIARVYNSPVLLIRILYERAWSAFWWYDDRDTLKQLYPEIENLISEDDYKSLELLGNLWCLQIFDPFHGVPENFSTQTESLFRMLQKASVDKTRINAGLWAKVQIHLMKTFLALRAGESCNDELKNLEICLTKSRHLNDFPLQATVELITEIGTRLGGNNAYESLFAVASKLQEKYNGEISSGILSLKRGMQLISQNEPTLALKHLGNAVWNLSKHDANDDLIWCHLALGVAYKKLDLFWAARLHLLGACNFLSKDMIEDGVQPRLLRAALELGWTELSLGRVEYVIESFSFSELLLNNISDYDESQRKEAYKELSLLDGILGILLLKDNVLELARPKEIISKLENKEMWISLLCANFICGKLDDVENDSAYKIISFGGSVYESFQNLLDQPARKDLPAKPIYHFDDLVEYSTVINGCKLNMKVQTNDKSLSTAETLLAALEAFFATTAGTELAFYLDHIAVSVYLSEFVTTPGEIFCSDEVEGFSIKIAVSKQIEFLPATQEDFKDFVMSFILKILENAAIAYDKTIQNIDENNAVGRALISLANVFFRANVFGYQRTEKLPNQEKDFISPVANLQHINMWKSIVEQVEEKENFSNSDENNSQEYPEKPNLVKHTQMGISSVINLRLWDQAKWQGVLYSVDMRNKGLPLLALVFTYEKPARLIFEQWRAKIGDKDKKNILRILIATEIALPSNDYRVAISASHKLMEAQLSDQANRIHYSFIPTRIHTMTPEPSSLNLERFLQAYEKLGAFLFAPALMSGVLFGDLAILKTDLIIRKASEIKDDIYDFDRVVLRAK